MAGKQRCGKAGFRPNEEAPERVQGGREPKNARPPAPHSAAGGITVAGTPTESANRPTAYIEPRRTRGVRQVPAFGQGCRAHDEKSAHVPGCAPRAHLHLPALRIAPLQHDPAPPDARSGLRGVRCVIQTGEREKPRHGDIVVVTIPAYTRRRRWCATCQIWTWERPFESGKFYHARGRRTRECKGVL